MKTSHTLLHIACLVYICLHLRRLTQHYILGILQEQLYIRTFNAPYKSGQHKQRHGTFKVRGEYMKVYQGHCPNLGCSGRCNPQPISPVCRNVAPAASWGQDSPHLHPPPPHSLHNLDSLYQWHMLLSWIIVLTLT